MRRLDSLEQRSHGVSMTSPTVHSPPDSIFTKGTSRRSALKVFAAAAAILQSKSHDGQESPAPIWKTSVGLNGFESSSRKYKKSFPIWDILDSVSRLGFNGVELVANWPAGPYPKPDQSDRIRALRRFYDAFGLRIFSLQFTAANAFAPESGKRRDWVAEFRETARFAKLAGCECIGMWPGGGLRGQTIDQAIDVLSESFREAGKIAADLGLLAAFEIEPPFVLNTEDHLRRILSQVNHPSLKTIYDPSHFDLMNGSSGKPHEMLSRIGVENIGYIHLTDTDGTLRDGGTSKHLPCGDGHAQIAVSLETLKKGGFRGWVNIDAWEIPDPYDACAKGKRAIDYAMK